MTKPEVKMEKYDEIQKSVKELRNFEVEQHELGKLIMLSNEHLENLGIRCNSVTNCVDVGKKCFKCKNNYARRSYFRDLLQKDFDVSIYATDASCFNAVTPDEL